MSDSTFKAGAGADGADGGNITFAVGKGQKDGVTIPGRDGSFIFMRANGTEALRIDPDGTFSVDGVVIDTRHEVYYKFRWWLKEATAAFEPGAVMEDGP